jgi:pyruvate/2-oxoglutarate dehydrogenase complex dihydrolipoamide dehydrogenase (E3) component
MRGEVLTMEQARVLPNDELNRALVANVRPPKWTNPTPAGRYNLVVIGAGTAGLITAAGAAGLGARVALIERHLMGGDCLNVGCVPSKSVIRSSRVIGALRDAASFGVRVDGGAADFGAVMRRMRQIRARISANDSAQRYASEKHVDVYFGAARFSGPDSVEVGGQTLRFKRAVIATGARAVEPPIDGLAGVGFLTNETVFSLTERPPRLAVIGGGPIGCELAQAFQRLGCQVTLINDTARLLNREDADAAEIVRRAFEREGIRLLLSSEVLSARSDGVDKVLRVRHAGTETEVQVDEILVGAGRAPNVEGLNLEAVGVAYDRTRGVTVDDNLRTTNRRIFAAGDICMAWKFTHAADFAARIVIQNALFFGRRRLSALHMPWCTYTEPEVAHVGLYERDAAQRGIAVDTYLRPFNDVDRAIADGEEEGFVKVLTRKGSGEIVGATVVARHAGEMISELTLAMVAKVGLGTVANAIHPYPTQAEAIRQVGDMYNRTRLTPTVKWLFERFLSLTR